MKRAAAVTCLVIVLVAGCSSSPGDGERLEQYVSPLVDGDEAVLGCVLDRLEVEGISYSDLEDEAKELGGPVGRPSRVLLLAVGECEDEL